MMQEWVRLSMLLCIFGVLREFRPSEPFVTKYLNNPPMNFTLPEIYSDVYPIATYSTMVLLVLIFLCTDILRYKAILILNGLSGVICYIMLIVCRSLFEIQVVEVIYGLFSACDVAYCTYIYNKVDKAHYQEVTSHTHGAYLIGRAISGISSQILISSNYFSYYDLNFFTLAGMLLATIWSCFLPSVHQSVYFHRVIPTCEGSDDGAEMTAHSFKEDEENLFSGLLKGFKYLLKDFIAAFSSIYVIKWIFWWSLATCGYYQVLSYMQVLWEVIDKEENSHSEYNYNGLVEAVYTILSALATLICGRVELDWRRRGEVILAICSTIIGGILLIASRTFIIYVAYVSDVLVKIIYHAMITIANSEVAKNIKSDSYALIFGVTNFIALVLQSLLTLVVNSILKLPARTQFVVYSVYFFGLGAFFAVFTLLSFIRNRNTKRIIEEPNQSTNQEYDRPPDKVRSEPTGVDNKSLFEDQP